LCAAHTPNFPQLLRQLGASLLVTVFAVALLPRRFLDLISDVPERLSGLCLPKLLGISY
jgi:hypothetical protein